MLRKENEMPVTTQYVAKAFGRVSLQIASKLITGRVDRAFETQLRKQGVRTLTLLKPENDKKNL